jgi:hypothetical protein
MCNWLTREKANENGVAAPRGDSQPPVSPAREQPGDPSPLSPVRPYEEWFRSNCDESDPSLWSRGYLAPAYEAYLVQRIADEVANYLGKMAPVHRVEPEDRGERCLCMDCEAS